MEGLIDRSASPGGNPYKRGAVGSAVNLRVVGWGVSFLLLAAVLAFVPGAIPAGEGPRLAMVTILIVLGLILAGSAILGPWMLRRSAMASGTGICPVGGRCKTCSEWNWRPRQVCGGCKAATQWATPNQP